MPMEVAMRIVVVMLVVAVFVGFLNLLVMYKEYRRAVRKRKEFENGRFPTNYKYNFEDDDGRWK